MIVCANGACRKSFPVDVYPLYCTCGKVTYEPHDGQAYNHWFPLHEFAIANWESWSESAAQAFLQQWLAGIPEACCGANWRAHRLNFRTDSPEHFFADANHAHNVVSKSLGLPTFSLAQAYGIWRKSGTYETDTKYLTDNRVDVVIPFCAADSQYVAEAVRSILAQQHVEPIIHCVADNNCAVPTDLELRRVRIHRMPSRLGPYRIANYIASQHAESNYLALLDADDIATPDRLWRQLATMQRFGYEMTSAAMQQFVQRRTAFIDDRFAREQVVRSGDKFHHVPNGRCLNSVRAMQLSMFLDLGGFADNICSMDFDFDNRCHYAGVPVFWSDDVIGYRRLHPDSLTNGPEYAHDTDRRSAANQLVLDNLAALQSAPNRDTARSLGALLSDKAVYRRPDAHTFKH